MRMSSRDLTTFGYRRIVILLVSLVVVPTVLLLALGVVLLFIGERLNWLMGILVLAFSGAAVTGVILVWVFVRREASLSQLQSDFVSKVSHELRTPLTAIRLFSETLALRQSDPEASQACIGGLSRESHRLQELIDRLLDWGQMESGRRRYRHELSSIASMVESTIARFDAEKEWRRAAVTLSMPATLPPVPIDRGALGDALLNLLSNAAKYGGEPPEIGLAVSLGSRVLRIAVSDNGSGIPAHEHKRIFQKFYRVDDRLSRIREGSGLGLAIAKHVVKAHRGRIEVRSAPGRGSVFTIVLPLPAGAQLAVPEEKP
jgi:two-component system, OmpR family, phosphate regulon sensor histidine kinase PhoR